MNERDASLGENAARARFAPDDTSAPSLESALRASLSGEAKFDDLHRAIYATDASIYQIVPRGVVMPSGAADVMAVLAACSARGVPVIARGAGTGLTGGAIGEGVVLDVSRFMNRLVEIDADARTATVQPGVVLDDLNRAAGARGLMFAPDVATSSRATIGGMIANNSCGANSVRFGRTVDHVESVTLALSDGTLIALDRDGTVSAHDEASMQRGWAIKSGLARIRSDYAEEIARRFPKVLRSSGGYGLDRLASAGASEGDIHPLGVVCGSEGTLGVVVEATVSLIPKPAATSLVVLSLSDMLAALSIVPRILECEPAAVELIDDLIIGAALRNPKIAATPIAQRLSDAAAQAVLVVQFFGDSAQQAEHAARALADAFRSSNEVIGAEVVLDPHSQQQVWELRKSGLGLLMSKPGDAQPIAFVEDSAVSPARLRDYIERFAGILKAEDVSAGYYAHASVGCIHVRPVLNLKRAGDVAKMERIADAVSDLALSFGGAMTGEHGDGILRSQWLEKTYGPKLVEAFREVKRLFDPAGLLNPGKIVDPLPMSKNLRYGANYRTNPPALTVLDFSAYGGMSGMAEMCSGVGECRRRGTGTMCPPFMALGDELHTTRARANALRVAMSDSHLLRGLDDPALDEVMDLCISCKACKTECPTQVDMARMKTELLHRRNASCGAPARARLIADAPEMLRRASRFPRIFNAIAGSGFARRRMERTYGLSAKLRPPRVAAQTFRAWWRRNRRRFAAAPAGSRRVLLFVDTWTDLLVPEVGRSAVRVLHAAGFTVRVARHGCCGRPLLSQGFLEEARVVASQMVTQLWQATEAQMPIVVLEPSCLSALVDEYPQLVRSRRARSLADAARSLEEVLIEAPVDFGSLLGGDRESATPGGEVLLVHEHCHTKALRGASAALSMLSAIPGANAQDSGAGCCGMAGAFGHETEHYDIARAIGQERLFPKIETTRPSAVVACGFSCRQQIAHHTSARPVHLAEHLASLLPD